MGLGVLEDRKLDNVPGTSYVLDDNDSRAPRNSPTIPGLKYDRSGPVPIILVPQPSDDPNDPLNWPLWKRDAILALLSFVSVLCATTSPIMAANTLTLSIYYERTFTEVALLTGYHLCGVGAAGFLFVPTARVWGKRHLFLLGNILMVISCAWAGASGQSYRSLLWARVFQGVALAPFEALVNASVGDLYFVHERGKRMALSNVALFGGAFLTPVFVGKITHSLGWQWTFYFVAIFTGVAFPFMFFFVPETAFRRANHLNTDFLGKVDYDQFQHDHDRERSDSQTPLDGVPNGDGHSNLTHYEKDDGAIRNGEAPQYRSTKTSYWRKLALFDGRKTDESFFKLLLRPFPLFLHPGIFWACLTQGVLIGWTVFIGVVLAALFMGPPLWFDEVSTGYLYTGAFIGSILGLVLSGLLSDSINKIMIKLNRGRYEPEFRILLVFFQLVFGGIGLYGFGITSEDVSRYGWLVSDVFLMFVIMGMVMGAVASALYIVDAHRQIAIEAFTCLIMFKNMFSFVLTFYAYDWLLANGVKHIFIIIASIQVAICLLSIPMYIFGKWNRSFFARHDLFKMLHLC